MDDQEKEDIRRWVKRREDMFLRRMFGMLGKMAKADGRIDTWEVHAAEKAFDRFPRAAARRTFCTHAFNMAGRSSLSLMKMAWDFANLSCALSDDCLAVYEILWDVACARGILRPSHKSQLQAVCRYLNLPEGCFAIQYLLRQGTVREWTAEDEKSAREETWKARFAREADSRRKPEAHSPLQAEYGLLECAPDASNDTVRNAYRTEAKKYHPDLLRAKGCSEEAIAAATARMASINAAWEKIRKARGF